MRGVARCGGAEGSVETWLMIEAAEGGSMWEGLAVSGEGMGWRSCC